MPGRFQPTSRVIRQLVAAYGEIFGAAYPAGVADAFEALRGDEPWLGPALLWADVADGSATIRPT